MAGVSLKQRWNAVKSAMRFGGKPYSISYGPYGTYGGYAWGKNVNYAQAVGDPLDNSIVAATVGWIGRTFPEAPIRVMRETAQGEEAVPAHPLTLKMRRPNPYHGGSLLWMPLMMSYILDGNAYLLKERSNGGGVLALWYVPHWTMEPRWNSPTSYVDYYQYRVDGVVTNYDPRDVIHLRNGIDPRNTRKGLSQIKSVIREIYGDNMATQYSAAMLSNYGTPSMILSPANADQSYTEDQAAVIKQNTIEKTTGDRRGEPIIFLDPVSVNIPAFAPAQMNVRDSQFTPEERVSAVIGIPAVVVGLGAGLIRSTFANYQQSREAAYESFLMPVQSLIAEELTAQLLPDFSDDPMEHVAFDYSEVRVLQPDLDAMFTRVEHIFAAGIIDRATAKRELDFDVQPEDANVYFLSRGSAFVSGELTDVGAALAPLESAGVTVPEDVPTVAPPKPSTNGTSKTPVPAAKR